MYVLSEFTSGTFRYPEIILIYEKEVIPSQFGRDNKNYFENLALEKKLFDITFSVQGRKVSAHKIVLLLTDLGFKNFLPQNTKDVLQITI